MMIKRFVRSLENSIATKEPLLEEQTQFTNLPFPKGKTYPVSFVEDSDTHWKVTLDYDAGIWFFDKSDVDFYYEGKAGINNNQLPDFQGGDRVATIKAIVEESKRQGLTKKQCAYVLATAHHECNFKPVVEAYWLSDAWRQKNLRYWPWFGRGYVQLTWRNNYLKYERITGVPLTQDANLALRPDVALFVLVHGMRTGTFTGRDLDDYINSSKTDFFNARRIVNGMDRAKDIAVKANTWLNRLTVY